MKAAIDLKTFREALGRVASIPGAKGSIPETRLVKLTADFEGLQLTRITPESVAVAACEAEIHDEGELLLDFGQLQSFVDRATTGPVVIEGKDGKGATVLAGRSRVSFDNIISNIERHDREEDMDSLTVNAGEVLEWIKATERAMATPDLGKPFAEGLILQVIEGKLFAIGGDGRRIHAFGTSIEGDEIDTMLPREFVGCLKGIVSATDAKTEIELEFGQNQVAVKAPSIEVQTVLFDIKAPRMDKMLEITDIDAKVSVSPSEMIDALRAANPFGKDEQRIIHLQLLTTSLTLTANNEKGADFRHEIDIKSKPEFLNGGSSMNFRCSANYLADMFQVFTYKETVTFIINMDGKSSFIEEDNIKARVLGMHDQPISRPTK